MKTLASVCENYYWLPLREVEHCVFDFFDLNGAYIQGIVKSNTDGSYTLTVSCDPEYDDITTEPFTGSAEEVISEASEQCEEDLSEAFFNLFYQAGDATAMKFLIAQRVGNDVDDDFLRIPLGHHFFTMNSFCCLDLSQIEVEAIKAMQEREKKKVASPSLDDFEEEIFDLYAEES